MWFTDFWFGVLGFYLFGLVCLIVNFWVGWVDFVCLWFYCLVWGGCLLLGLTFCWLVWWVLPVTVRLGLFRLFWILMLVLDLVVYVITFVFCCLSCLIGFGRLTWSLA